LRCRGRAGRCVGGVTVVGAAFVARPSFKQLLHVVEDMLRMRVSSSFGLVLVLLVALERTEKQEKD
jgi:hypothetical protein